MATESGLDLCKTYMDLADGGAARPIAVTERFWPELMSGERRIEGRLMAAFHVGEDAPHWEMHPHGEELVILQSGSVDFVLEAPEGERIVELRPAARCCLVPRGLWHRFVVREPGELLFITHGEGTQHRPLGG